MEILGILIIFMVLIGIPYVLPVLLGVITSCVLWYKERKNGYTVQNINCWLLENTSQDLELAFVPLMNWVFVISIIAYALGPKKLIN